MKRTTKNNAESMITQEAGQLDKMLNKNNGECRLKPTGGNSSNGSNGGYGERGRKKKHDDLKTQKSFFEEKERIYEQIYYDGKSKFLYYDTTTKDIGEVDNVGNIFPVELKHNEHNTVGLPETATNFYDQYDDEDTAEADLLIEVEKFIHRYVDIDSSFRTFAASYVLLSWLYDRFYSIPYLRFLGDFGTGKSRALDVIGGICYRPLYISGSTSAASIFRVIDRWGGTLILDEADFRYSDETAEIIKILNQGFERNRTVLRVNKNDFSLDHFQVFGPKIISSRKKFQDDALESRCLSTTTQQTNRNDIPYNLGNDFYAKQNELRKKLLMYRLKNWNTLNPEKIDINLRIEPRLKQITTPFFVLFEKNPVLLEEFKNFILDFQNELIQDRASTSTGQVVNMLFELFEDSGRKIEKVQSGTTEITVTSVTPGQIAGKLDMKSEIIGRILKGVGLKTRTSKSGGKTGRYVEYSKEHFETLQRRYIPLEDTKIVENEVEHSKDRKESQGGVV